MRTNEEVPKEINWAVVLAWSEQLPKRVGSHSINLFIQEAEPFKFSWVIFYLWAFVRSERFTSPACYANKDVGNMGGKFLTYREATRVAAAEFSKFSDTSMIKEEAEILELYDDLLKFARQENPTAKEPITEPPAIPKPIDVPRPKPEPEKPKEAKPPKAPDTPKSRAKIWGTVTAIGSVLVFGLGVASYFVPALKPIYSVIKLVMKMLGGVELPEN